MKLIKISLLVAIIGLATFCKAKKQASSTTPEATTSKNCPTTVNFASSGSGIDSKAYDNIKLLLDSKKIKYTEERKGREGETKMCVESAGLSRSENESVIKSLKDIAANAQLVSVSTN